MHCSFRRLTFLFLASTPFTIHAAEQQKPLVIAGTMAGPEPVRGHNNATYNTVPKEEQLFSVEFLEIAPTPIKADRVFFVYLRGWIPSKAASLNLETPESGLISATLKVSSSANYPDGSSDPTESITIPFKSTSFNSLAHLVIRDDKGEQVDHLPTTGGDALFDFQIPSMFLKTGEWTFEVDARAGDPDDTCLFAFKSVQWLEGGGG